MFVLADFKVGDRVELHPGTDAWMRGDRFGTVELGERLTVAAHAFGESDVYVGDDDRIYAT